MKHFGPSADIFSVAATLYTMFSQRIPHPINDPIEKHEAFSKMKCTEKTKTAIVEGLAYFANDRPQDAQHFLINFDGCEDIKL